MQNIEIIKEIKMQLGRVPTANEVIELCDKPSIILGKKNSRKSRKIEEEFLKYKNRRNQSWYSVLREILIKTPNHIAIKYRGTNITNEEFINKVETLASKFIEMGVKKGDIIAVCMSNTPEYIYVKCALNLIGAVCNSFSSNYSAEKINEILESCSKKIMVCTDVEYKELKKIDIKCDRIIMSSLKDSLSDASVPPKEYSEGLRRKLNKYYQYNNYIPEYKKNDSRIIALSEIMSSKKINHQKITELLNENIDSEAISSITYTSGSTSENPKGLVHTNSSVIISYIRHTPKIAGSSAMKGLTSLFNIHTDSNTGNITQMLDILFQEGTVAPEPEYSLESFLDILYLNQPNLAASTTSLFVAGAKKAKQYYSEGIYEKMPWLIAPIAVGEGMSENEHKFLNSFLHFVKAGKGFKIGNLTLPIATVMSIGGGDCERGGIFFTLFKKFKDIKSKALYGKKHGLDVYPDTKVAVIDPVTLDELNFGETGLIVCSKTHGTFKNYVGSNTQIESIKDKYGREWSLMNTEGSINRNGSLNIIGRYQEKVLVGDMYISINELNELVLSLDRIFSCSTIVVNSNNSNFIVINYVPCKTPEDRKNNIDDYEQNVKYSIYDDIKRILENKYGKGILEYVKMRRISDSFPVTGSCKRSIPAIRKMELENTEDIGVTKKLIKA